MLEKIELQLVDANDIDEASKLSGYKLSDIRQLSSSGKEIYLNKDRI